MSKEQRSEMKRQAARARWGGPSEGKLSEGSEGKPFEDKGESFWARIARKRWEAYERKPPQPRKGVRRPPREQEVGPTPRSSKYWVGVNRANTMATLEERRERGRKGW